MPPSIIAMRPLNVAHRPKKGVICSSVARMAQPATPPTRDTSAKAHSMTHPVSMPM